MKHKNQHELKITLKIHFLNFLYGLIALDFVCFPIHLKRLWAHIKMHKTIEKQQ